MKFTFDPEARALYVEIKPGEVVGTVQVQSGVYADVDAQSNVLGFEVLEFSGFINSHTDAGAVVLDIPTQLVTSG